MGKVNIYQGQVQGPFKAYQDVVDIIREQCVSTEPFYIKHLGIQTETHDVLQHPETLVELVINGKIQTIEIGKSGIYEIGSTCVTSIKFLNNRDNNTIIDYVLAKVGDEPAPPGPEPSPEPQPADVNIILIVEDTEERNEKIRANTYYYIKQEDELWYCNPDKQWELVLQNTGGLYWEDLV